MAEVDFNNLDDVSDIDEDIESEYYDDDDDEYYAAEESDNDNIDDDQNKLYDKEEEDEDEKGEDDDDDDLNDSNDIIWTDEEYILWLEESSENDKVLEKYDKNSEEGKKQLVLVAKNMLGHLDDTIFVSNQGLSTNIKDKLKLKKITLPILTKYEKTLLISTRAQQIANGSIILVDINKIMPNVSKPETIHMDIAKNIAYEELRLNRIPFIIKRTLPNKTYEYWKISELLDAA